MPEVRPDAEGPRHRNGEVLDVQVPAVNWIAPTLLFAFLLFPCETTRRKK